ncbi:MAG: hypothetical protein D6748_01325 [Calditrichaeota bacterium]|nr:MAG: hypothetical protein D6748_01325 [Calditrichota bacterium]
MKITNYLLLIVLLTVFWGCEQKKPVNISGFSPTSPTNKPLFFREDLKSGGDFSPGYTSGKIQSKRITLDWQQNTDEDFLAYLLFRDGVQIASLLNASDNRYIDSTVTQNTLYQYRLVVENTRGLYQEDTISIKTPRFLPPSDFGTQVLALDGTILKIFWKNNAESANQFRIYRKIATDPEFEFLAITSDTFYVDDNNIISGQVYEYQLSAFNDFEETPRSNSLLVGAFYSMFPPLLTSVTQALNSKEVVLQWIDQSTAEDGFRIWRRLASETNFTLVGTVITDTRQFVDTDTTNLFVDSVYVYGVTAFNTFGETPLSNTMTIQIQPPTSFTGYVEDFEDPLGPEWELSSSTPEGRIERSNIDSHLGQYMLLMDVSVDGVENTNYAVLNIDLSGVPSTRDLILRYYYNTYNDEVTSEDALEISPDGTAWTLVTPFTSSPFFWSLEVINLRDYYDQVPYSATYKIRWKQSDNLSYPNDGIGLDDISVNLQ